MKDLNRRTKQLLATASHGRVGILNFERQFPEIAEQLRRDAHLNCFDCWGQSRNVDEYQHEQIVDPKLLSTIGRLANYPIREGTAYHAGLIHTYGYLLSTLRTRFGYKRERWTSGVIESGFGIQSGLFSPTPPSGTLLANVTFFLLAMAFPSDARLKKMRTDSFGFSKELTSFAFDKVAIQRIKETVQFPTVVGRSKPRRANRLELLTDLARFSNPKSFADSLVVYSYRLDSQQKLVTCFPIDELGRQKVLREAKTNESEIRPRYNLFLKSFRKPGFKGTRQVFAR